jgi:hypothetical protein
MLPNITLLQAYVTIIIIHLIRTAGASNKGDKEHNYSAEQIVHKYVGCTLFLVLGYMAHLFLT